MSHSPVLIRVLLLLVSVLILSSSASQIVLRNAQTQPSSRTSSRVLTLPVQHDPRATHASVITANARSTVLTLSCPSATGARATHQTYTNSYEDICDYPKYKATMNPSQLFINLALPHRVTVHASCDIRNSSRVTCEQTAVFSEEALGRGPGATAVTSTKTALFVGSDVQVAEVTVTGGAEKLLPPVTSTTKSSHVFTNAAGQHMFTGAPVLAGAIVAAIAL